jgi:hypothetical protein
VADEALNLDSIDGDSYFAPIASVVEALAQKRHLRLQRYYHDRPVWDLKFLLPTSGAIGKVCITPVSESSVELRALLWQDDYAKGSRTMRHCNAIRVSRNGEAVEHGLNLLLDRVIAEKTDGEPIVAGGYAAGSQRYSAEEFARMSTDGLQIVV